MQDRHRLTGEVDADGRPQVEAYLKPRITTNSSHGGDDSVNAGVSAESRRVELPLVQWLARAAAICDEAGWARVQRAVGASTAARCEMASDGGEQAGGDARREASARAYCVDAESAYSFCPMQRADWWTQCCVWWDEHGKAGVCVDTRMGFGGAFAPNRFERISTLVAAYIRSLQEEFDAQEPPACAAGWRAARTRAMQSDGLLGDDRELLPAFRMIYIDDLGGVALDDEVTPPASVAEVVIPPEPTTAAGGTFSPPGTRVHVHAQLAVKGMRDLGLEAAPGKVTVGDGIVVLGFAIQVEQRRLACPSFKRATMLHGLAELRRETDEPAGMDGRRARRMVGRLNNLSQAFPELAASLHGGYTATSARRNGALLSRIRLAAGGRVREDWLALLAVAEELLTRNEGVPLAPAYTFASRFSAGTAVAVTDASGDDGVGGYVFFADRPGHVWVVCERWPEAVRQARANADAVVAARTRGAPALSMPSAEAFGGVVIPRAAAAAAGVHVEAVIAVTDCQPAAGALNKASGGGVPQMRRLVAAARSWVTQWLGVHVPRELNVDADTLSHPGGFEAIEAKAARAGIVAHPVRLVDYDWRMLEEVAGLGMGGGGAEEDRNGGKRGRQRQDEGGSGERAVRMRTALAVPALAE